jgi:hypothetical protein
MARYFDSIGGRIVKATLKICVHRPIQQLPTHLRDLALKTKIWLASIAASVALCACAPSVPVQGVQFTPVAATQQQRIRIVDTVHVRLSTGYSRRISSGSLWRLAGELPQGFAYRPINDVFTVEGRQVHEAWLVVKNDHLVGFYLPGESHFSPLDPTQSITTETLHD